MNENQAIWIKEIMGYTAEAWKAIAIAAGHNAGLFNILKTDTAIRLDDLAKQKGYDPWKVRKWAEFAERIGILGINNDSATLTEKGALYGSASPIKDVLAFIEETGYFVKAAANADMTFRTNLSLDKLSDGKISKDYQPKVSDNLSAVLINHCKGNGMVDGDSLLDIGCGNGSFLRSFYNVMPGLEFTGMDVNLFAIEKAKKENIALGLADKIKMVVGDILEDLDDIPDKSSDWVIMINVLYFVPEDQRDALIDNIIRISRKGAIFNTVQEDSSLINSAANPLLNLLWNDFVGFYPREGVDKIIAGLPQKYHGYTIHHATILQGNAELFSVLKK